MSIKTKYVVILVISGFISGCVVSDDPEPAEAQQQGFYQTMDYGPVIAESIEAGWPEKSLVRKGLVIKLDHGAAMIFDTDLLRFAAGTSGGWIDISETDYTSYKGSRIPSIEGRQVFGTSAIAGWARDGSFEGPRQDGLGNLPRDWAHYRGYFRYGDQVVLSYSVGETGVLELPQAISRGQSIGFVRTLRVDASGAPLQALVFEKPDTLSVVSAAGRGLVVDSENGSVAAHLIDAPEGVLLQEGQQGRIELHVPSSSEPQTIRLLIFEMDSPGDTLLREYQEMLRAEHLPDLVGMTQGGPSRWNQEIQLSGVLSSEEAGYVVDRIPVPFENPWGSWMRLSGLEFYEDGRHAVVTTWNGDVWIVSGIDERLEDVRWRRFASGLFYPMGVALVDDAIFVTERSQLTRLHDLNGNGEADYYENFNNDGIVHPMAHSLGLEVDSEGYFYFFKNGNRVPSEVPQHGALMRVSPDGSTREVYARGYRGANTLGIGPDDQIVGADQEGNWVPVDRIDVLKQGGFYGDRRHGGEDLEVGEFEPPIAWTPKSVNNSAGSITYAGDERWGPLSGNWVLGSYGQRSLLVVLAEEMNGRMQGGVVPLPLAFSSGTMRARVGPADGQLYVIGLRGWQTLGIDDGSFERVRYTGGKTYMPEALHVKPEGVQITFTEPLDPESAQSIENYTVERWEYLYSQRYGSPERSLERPGEEGRDRVHVESVDLSADGRTVFLKIADMISVMQMRVGFALAFEDGHEVENAIYHTVNWLSPAEAGRMPAWQARIIAGQPETLASPAPEEDVASADESRPAWYRQGAESYQRNCASCHVAGGVAPAMDDSEWAAGSHEGLVRILLQGKVGNQGIMTPFAWMSNEDLASLVSYIRVRWHEKEPLSAAEISRIRQITSGRTEPWTARELEPFRESE